MTFEQEMEQFREACLDTAYLIFKALGFPRLVRRLGMTPRPWVLDREKRGL
jgi:hypothetical protein